MYGTPESSTSIHQQLKSEKKPAPGQTTIESSVLHEKVSWHKYGPREPAVTSKLYSIAILGHFDPTQRPCRARRPRRQVREHYPASAPAWPQASDVFHAQVSNLPGFSTNATAASSIAAGSELLQSFFLL